VLVNDSLIEAYDRLTEALGVPKDVRWEVKSELSLLFAVLL
jgi:hypothetical protein